MPPPPIRLTYLRKKRGGRLNHVATFVQQCDARVRADAEWIMEHTLQAFDEAVETEFSFVGSTTLGQTPCVVKMMERGVMAKKEINALEWFRTHPYRHIVQGICHFNCRDSTIRWQSRLPAPQPFCGSGSGNTETEMTIIVQEYIPGGDLETTNVVWTKSLWKSLFFQLTFACFEFYEMGFTFGDWNFGNILMDTTDEIETCYRVFGKNKRVKTEGICPVLTDFARSIFFQKEARVLEHLTDNLGILWGLLRHKCPVTEWKPWLNEKSIEIGQSMSKTAIQRVLHEVQSYMTLND